MAINEAMAKRMGYLAAEGGARSWELPASIRGVPALVGAWRDGHEQRECEAARDALRFA